MNAPDDDAFAQHLRGLLRESEKRLDFVTAARLAAARERALCTPGAPRSPRQWLWALPGMLAAGMAVWMLLPNMQPLSNSGALPHAPILAVEDPATQAVAMDVLAHEEAMPVYTDLEFYQWLQDTNGAS